MKLTNNTDLGLVAMSVDGRDLKQSNPTLISLRIYFCGLTSRRVARKYLLKIVTSSNVRRRSRQPRATPKQSNVGTGGTVDTQFKGRGDLIGINLEPHLLSTP